MFDLWKAHQGRRAAVTALLPFVEQSRRKLQEIPTKAWLDPYQVGFIATLITLIAKRRYQQLGDSALARIQSAAWGDITGIDADIIGEEICLLSTARNRSFEQGCQNAVWFFRAMYPEQWQLSAQDADQLADAFMNVTVAAETGQLRLGQDHGRTSDTDDLWAQYFEAHV